MLHIWNGLAYAGLYMGLQYVWSSVSLSEMGLARYFSWS